MVVRQIDNVVWHKFNAALRAGIVKGALTPFSEHLLVNEYPKSGGSWAAQMLADALDMPFPRNRLPMLRSSIIHGHYLGKTGLKKTIIVWRDGRDVAVSWYFHFVIGHSLTSRRAVQIVREAVGYDERQSESERFSRALEYFLTRPRFPRFTWSQFVQRWASCENCIHIRYEDMIRDTLGELRRVYKSVTGHELPFEDAKKIVEKFSFSRQTGRKPGEEKKKDYLRKGIVGDWKNHFDVDAKRLFHLHAGDQLISLGYEKDRSWVERVTL